jgi:hypothetical protein
MRNTQKSNLAGCKGFPTLHLVYHFHYPLLCRHFGIGSQSWDSLLSRRQTHLSMSPTEHSCKKTQRVSERWGLTASAESPVSTLLGDGASSPKRTSSPPIELRRVSKKKQQSEVVRSRMRQLSARPQLLLSRVNSKANSS